MQKLMVPSALKFVSDAGVIEFYASIFGNRDLQGDRVLHGAFDDSIVSWQAKGVPFPIVWSHAYDRPQNIIGSADPFDLVADAKGLRVTAQLDIEANPQAKWVHSLAKRRIATGASFAYDIVKQRKAADANELVRLNLIEAGPCLIGANPEAGVIDAKDLNLMTGAELNALFEQLGIELKTARSGREMQDKLERFYEWLELEQTLATY